MHRQVLTFVVAVGLLLPLASTGPGGPRAEAASAASADVQHTLVVHHADGRDSTIPVLGWTHEILSPRDAASGLPTGRRQHKPFVVTKPVDKSTPLLLSAILHGETFAGAALTSTRREGGRRVPYLVIELEKCVVTSLQMSTGEDEDAAGFEHVALTYEKITWKFPQQGVEHEDSWRQPQ